MKTTKAFRLQEVRQSHTDRIYGRDRILDADIRGFFDAIDHGWLMKVVEHRTLHPYPEQRLRVMT